MNQADKDTLKRLRDRIDEGEEFNQTLLARYNDLVAQEAREEGKTKHPIYCHLVLSHVDNHVSAFFLVAPSLSPEGNKLKRKERPAQSMLDVKEFVESMTAEGVAVPRHGLNSTLRIPREALVQKVVQLAEEIEQNVYIRGAAGTGKTVLLELIALHLQSVGKRAVFIQHISELQDCWGDIHEILRDKKPLYVLVDEAHMIPANDPVWMYLKKPRSPFITIAAGIPDDSRSSAMFSRHIEVKEMFLTVEELISPEVVKFYADRLSESLRIKGIVVDAAGVECAATVNKLLSFAHMFTNGHSFPCLKMAEFFVTAECERCRDTHISGGDMEVSLTQSLSSPAFDAVYDTIYHRCYHMIAGNTFERLISAWWSDAGMSEAVLDELTRLGLWLREDNCLISLLLQQVVLKKRGDAGRLEIENVSQDNFGNVLVYALSSLREKHFQQMTVGEVLARERCEDGIGLFIGAELSGIEGIYLSPQHALPRPGQRGGRPPSVDYYLNHVLDMYLELTRNGSLLKDHFKRFQPGGKYHGKAFVVLDIELAKTTPPKPLPEEVREFEHCRYTYIHSLNTLYRGTDIFKAGVIPLTISS